MSGNREMKKILAMALVSIMVCASIVIVLPNNTVMAEDSAKPFVDLNTGYPLPSFNLDQEQSMEGTIVTMSGFWMAQTFTAGITENLAIASIHFASWPDVEDISVYIYDTSGGLPNTVMATETLAGPTVLDNEWFNVTFDPQPSLIIGVQYAVVFKSSGSGGSPDLMNMDVYAGGSAYQSFDGNTWMDVNNPLWDFTFRTYYASSESGLTNIAWHESGDYALAVSGADDGNIYRYQRSNNTWYLAFNTNPSGTNNDIIYDATWENFFIVGAIGGFTHSYTWNETFGLVDLGSTFSDGPYEGVVACSAPYYFLAVGHDLANVGKFAWYNKSSASYEEYFTPSDEWLYDVTYSPTEGNYYAVGDLGGTGIVYQFDYPGDSTGLRISDAWNDTFSPLYSVDWSPLGGGNNYGLMAGSNSQGNGNVHRLNPGPSYDSIMSTSDTIWDIDWHPNGEMAILVGETNVGNGAIYSHYPQNLQSKLSNDPDYPSPFYGIAMKGYSSPSSGLIIGNSGSVGFYPSAIDSGTTITVNAAFPHNFDIDMWKTSDGIGGSSKLNTQVDVEETYTFMAEVNYSVSGTDQFYADGVNDVRIELSAFFDEGATPGVFPATDDQHRTRAFVALWEEGNVPFTDTASMQYPIGSPGTDEFTLDSFWLDSSAPGDHYYIYINITFGPQTWAASGPFGGASTDINDDVQSLDDSNTWDFEMRIYDSNYGGATNSTYEEFGIFQHTNITVSGNPGGNAPPGSNAQLGPNSQIAVSSNIDYYVNVSIPDLAKVGGGLPILATNVAVNITSPFANNTNSMINGTAMNFPGANQTLSIWGNTSQAFGDWVVAAPLNSTTAHGSQGADFQSIGTTDLEWWIDVPGGTAEGVYQASVTFRIGYY